MVLLKILSEFLDNSRISEFTNRGLPEISSNSKMAADDDFVLFFKETTGPTEHFISPHQVPISDQFHIGAS